MVGLRMPVRNIGKWFALKVHLKKKQATPQSGRGRGRMLHWQVLINCLQCNTTEKDMGKMSLDRAGPWRVILIVH